MWGYKSEKQRIETAFVQSQASLITVVGELDKELERMKQRNLSDDLIATRDLQIDTIVRFSNDADEAFQFYKASLLQLRLENHFLTEMIAAKLSLADVTTYKPSTKIIIQKVNDTDLPHTLSEVNG